ncbi:hypothetical protein [Vagococcus fluvialis]|uniref:Uncharacterized protein n=1 Tax=Vagococcus fluvialis TaxID=2738 RepID=A0A7X6I4G9_9ENTE|nr:hypothetical protein [Vagococcus fluvialis]NKC68979.1 hypothetical protein [Vagococcus fluvialis]
MNRSDFDKAFDKADKRIFEEMYTKDKIFERLSDAKNENNAFGVTESVLFNTAESRLLVEKYVYTVLEELFNVQDDQ